MAPPPAYVNRLWDEAERGAYVIIIIIEGLSLLQSIPPTTADKQTQAQNRRGSRSRKLLGAKAKSYRLKN